jgi:hypothetical protein
MKGHPDIHQNDCKSIHVQGKHLRDPPARISPIEKHGEPFNWQRPTSLIHTKDTAKILCFPGLGYVKHYASILATYLSLQGRDPSAVSFTTPTHDECMTPLPNSNLRRMGPVDIVVCGYVHGLKRFTSDAWVGGDETQIFAWQKMRTTHGATVAFLGCRVSFWGEIAGNLVRALQEINGVKTVLYVGKLGNLRPELPPNKWLATGTASMVDGEMVSWKSALDGRIAHEERVLRGTHYSLPSVLDETKEWLEAHKGVFDWVNPEVGHMAKASIEGDVNFGFLHIISDNIAKKYKYDLSNERLKQVLQDREMLVDAIQDTVAGYVAAA